MKEKQKHLDAFEAFYAMGGVASDENVRVLSVKSQVTERTIWRWYKSFGWKERVHLRDIDVADKVAEKTTSTIADNKAKYLTFVHKIIDDLKRKFEQGEIPVEIKSVSDLDKAIKLGLLLQDEATDRQELKGVIQMKHQGLARLKRIEAKHNDNSHGGAGDPAAQDPGGSPEGDSSGSTGKA